MKGVLLEEILIYAGKYQFSFQFWGDDNNNVFIYKGDVELESFGGRDTVEELFSDVLEWIYRVNRVPEGRQLFNRNPNF